MNRTSTIKDVESALKRGFLWIGEALLRHWGETSTPADDPVALQIYDLCAKFQVPITVHQDSGEYRAAYTELERALDHSPNCVFVFHGWWLGQGHLTTRSLEGLILRHPNLYVELAGELELSAPPWTEQTFLGKTSRDPFSYSDGRIRDEWRSLFENHPDRFINGFDFFTQSAYKFESIKMRADYWRNLLGQLNQKAAEEIAYKNVEDILAHVVNLRTRTMTVGTTLSTHTTAVATQTTRMSTSPQTTATSEAEIMIATSTQVASGVFAIEVMVIIVGALVIVAAGVFYLRRRRK
jgi:hypothetical protein